MKAGHVAMRNHVYKRLLTKHPTPLGLAGVGGRDASEKRIDVSGGVITKLKCLLAEVAEVVNAAQSR